MKAASGARLRWSQKPCCSDPAKNDCKHEREANSSISALRNAAGIKGSSDNKLSTA